MLTAYVALQTARQHGAVTKALDIGCGIGSVLLMVAWGTHPGVRCVGIEAQQVSCNTNHNSH